MSRTWAWALLFTVAVIADDDGFPSCAELKPLHAFAGGPVGRFGQSTRIYRNAHDDRGRTTDAPADACDPASAPLARHDDCGDVTSVEHLRDRGWVVLRGLMPPDEADALVAATPIAELCRPQKPACRYNPEQVRALLPGFAANVARVLGGWERTGVAARAELGRGLRLTRGTNAARRVQVVSDKTFARLRAADASIARHDRYVAGWHADNSGSPGTTNAHRIWVMVAKDGAARHAGAANVCLVPTAAVDRCDGPRFRFTAMADPGWVRAHVFERLACCPEMAPGDAVFYREDVFHRTGPVRTIATRMNQRISHRSTLRCWQA